MIPLKVERTRTTPEICFDAETKLFYLRGESLPENSFKFYAPVLKWLDDFKVHLTLIHEKNKTIEISFEFFLEYINSSSFKFIFDILAKIESLKTQNCSPKIVWKYDVDDDANVKENGEELKLMYENLPFVIIGVNSSSSDLIVE